VKTIAPHHIAPASSAGVSFQAKPVSAIPFARYANGAMNIQNKTVEKVSS
jgi:hypothetical protein